MVWFAHEQQPILVAAHEGSGSRLQTQSQKMTEISSSGQRSQFNNFNYKKNQLNIKRWARHQSALRLGHETVYQKQQSM